MTATSAAGRQARSSEFYGSLAVLGDQPTTFPEQPRPVHSESDGHGRQTAEYPMKRASRIG